jgi:curved DNA-binding protein CbpA
MSSTDLEDVEPHSRRADTFTLDIELAKPPEENIHATDYYEILRVGPQADEDTIERVYATLADRFHPDNPSTGDLETFLRLREAYETLSNPARRAEYNALRHGTRGSARLWLRSREFFDGVRGGQNRRLAVLCLLYRKRISTHEAPGLTILDLERLTGCTREELTYALWYLCEKNWATIGEFTAYSVTADGFDVVEGKLEDQLELRSLATLCYYDLPAELGDPAHVELRVWINDTRSLDIEAAGALGRDGSAADYYEILGIGPQSDEEDIERVFHTLAGRFHPDNPSTGDERTFLRVREAYDTLSDPAKRAKYDALRQRTKESTRFRLRGREFFDGIKGEQLRRLAVLCLLYRQAACEASGLRVLDLEQLTGCTREELGSALWYLREKKWAKYGEFTQYSITAAGCDFVENKLEDREAARSRAWLNPEDSRGNEFVYLHQASAALPAAPNQQNVPVTLESPTSITIAPESLNSPRTAESGQTDTQAEEPPDEQLAVAPGSNEIPESNQIEDAPVPAGQVTRFEADAAQPAAGSQQIVSVTPEPAITSTQAPEEREAVGLWDWLFSEDVYGNEFVYGSQDHVAVTPEPPISNTIAPENQNGTEPEGREAAGSWAWLYPKDIYGNEFVYPHEEIRALPAARIQQRLPAPTESPTSNTAIAAENQNSQQMAESELIPMVEASGTKAQVIWFEDEAELEEWDADGSQAKLIPEEPPDENMEVAQGLIQMEKALGIAEQVTRFEDGAEPEEREAVELWAWLYPEDTYGTELASLNRANGAVTPQSPISNTIALEDRASQRMAESERTEIKSEALSVENVEAAQVAIAMEEASGTREEVIWFEDVPEPETEEAAGSQSWLHPEDTFGTEFIYLHQAGAALPAAQGAIPVEEVGTAEQGTHFEVGAEPAAPSEPNVEVTPPSPGIARTSVGRAVKRVVFSMGGKGGVGKTNVMTGLAEWFEENRIPVTLLDLDTENKAKGSLTHFFGGRVPKINIHTPAGLDAFVDILAEEAPAILADMGAGAGQVTHDWFDKMYPDVTEVGIVFTAIGVVTSDPASVESVLNWAAALQDRVDYVIVENQLTENSDFAYWQENELAEEFRRRFRPAVIRLDCRLADLENASRNYGVTLGRVAGRTALQPELQKASLVMRAQSYRRRMFAEFDKVKELLLP